MTRAGDKPRLLGMTRAGDKPRLLGMTRLGQAEVDELVIPRDFGWTGPEESAGNA
jgi:hypothetical protein